MTEKEALQYAASVLRAAARRGSPDRAASLEYAANVLDDRARGR